MHGFAIKKFAPTALEADLSHAPPGVDEMQAFTGGGGGGGGSGEFGGGGVGGEGGADDDELASMLLSADASTDRRSDREKMSAALEAGDTVRVVAGDLKHLVAKVVGVDKRQHMVSISSAQLEGMLPAGTVMELTADKFTK